MINTAVNSTAVIRYSHFARNRIINEYGLMLTEYVGLFQFSIFQGKFSDISQFRSTSSTHKERRLNATIFECLYYFGCGRGFRNFEYSKISHQHTKGENLHDE